MDAVTASRKDCKVIVKALSRMPSLDRITMTEALIVAEHASKDPPVRTNGYGRMSSVQSVLEELKNRLERVEELKASTIQVHDELMRLKAWLEGSWYSCPKCEAVGGTGQPHLWGAQHGIKEWNDCPRCEGIGYLRKD
jgi:hypothetical protein